MRGRLRRVGLFVASVITAVGLSACGGITITRTTAPPSPTLSAVDKDYLSDVHEDASTGALTDANLVGMGHAICNDLDKGFTMHHEIVVLVRSGVEPHAGAAIFTAALFDYCPRQLT